MMNSDVKYMKLALAEAKKGLGRTSPNPAVGALIVKDDHILSRGYHRKAGLPHAEVEALAKIGGSCPGAALYVTLEPCNHFGKTPPCTESILKAGIARVVVGAMDPNPGVRGGGCGFLAENGVEVKSGVLERDCRSLNEDFFAFITTGRPFVIAKSAQTLDGWTATSRMDSKWVTNEKSRRFVHRLRDRVDAVMVGAGTIVADNPSLTTRLKNGKGKNPLRVILDTHARTPADARIFNDESPHQTLLVVGEGFAGKKLDNIREKGVSILPCSTRNNRLDLKTLMSKLGDMAIMSLLVEGGSQVLGSLIRDELVNKFHIFKAPKILGGNDGIPMASGSGARYMRACIRLENLKFRRFGEDMLITGYPVYRKPEDPE